MLYRWPSGGELGVAEAEPDAEAGRLVEQRLGVGARHRPLVVLVDLGEVLDEPAGEEGGEGQLRVHDELAAVTRRPGGAGRQALDDVLAGVVALDRAQLGGPDVTVRLMPVHPRRPAPCRAPHRPGPAARGAARRRPPPESARVGVLGRVVADARPGWARTPCPVGHTRASIWASCPAPEGMRRTEWPEPLAPSPRPGRPP